MDDQEELIIIWEKKETTSPEFRLYYDEKGNVLTYTCEKLDGDYIIIDALTFAEARPDVRVVDGRLVRADNGAVISRLFPSDNGVLCEIEDVSIITTNNGQYWKLKTTSV